MNALRESARTRSSMPEARGRGNCDFEGLHYVRVGQARAREAALCESPLPVAARLLLLVMSEAQVNGCCPMGPETWGDALGVDHDEAREMIAAFAAVGFLTNDSDLHCLHVHGRAIDKGAGRKKRCGKEAAVGRSDKRARPRRHGYDLLVRTGAPFRPPCTRPVT